MSWIVLRVFILELYHNGLITTRLVFNSETAEYNDHDVYCTMLAGNCPVKLVFLTVSFLHGEDGLNL